MLLPVCDEERKISLRKYETDYFQYYIMQNDTGDMNTII